MFEDGNAAAATETITAPSRMTRAVRAERDQEIIERYQAGESGEELAAAFDITSERVRQILVKHGVPRRGRQRRREASS